MGFDGAKLALYLGDRLAVILRDDRPGLLFPGHWDLPGGGREGDETPLACALRECQEELGIVVPEQSVVWQAAFDEAGRTKWFFVAHLPEAAAAEIVFGDEGQRWTLMTEEEFLNRSDAVPAFQDRLQVYLRGKAENANGHL